MISMLLIWIRGSRQEQIQFVVPENALGHTGCHLLHDALDYGWAIRSSVDQVSHIDQASTFWVVPFLGIAHTVEQFVQGIGLAVHIADDIDGTGEERPNQRPWGRIGHGAPPI
jgi:hypothetical protein